MTLTIVELELLLAAGTGLGIGAGLLIGKWRAYLAWRRTRDRSP